MFACKNLKLIQSVKLNHLDFLTKALLRRPLIQLFVVDAGLQRVYRVLAALILKEILVRTLGYEGLVPVNLDLLWVEVQLFAIKIVCYDPSANLGVA